MSFLLHSSRRGDAILYNGLPLYPFKTPPFPRVIWTPSKAVVHWINRSPQLKRCLSTGSAVFAQLTAAERPWTASNAWFVGPVQFHISNGILIGSAILQGHDREFTFAKN